METVTLSPASAHPQIGSANPCCNTILSEIIAGSFTAACKDTAQIPPNTAAASPIHRFIFSSKDVARPGRVPGDEMHLTFAAPRTQASSVAHASRPVPRVSDPTLRLFANKIGGGTNASPYLLQFFPI